MVDRERERGGIVADLVQVKHKCADSHARTISIAGHVYSVVAPSDLLHEVVDGKVSKSSGVHSSDADRLLLSSPQFFERVKQAPPPVVKTKMVAKPVKKSSTKKKVK